MPTTNGSIKILMLEEVATDAELAMWELRAATIEIETHRVDNRARFVLALDAFAPDIILSDFSLPTFDGLSALAIARERHPDIPFIFVSGTIGEEAAINALKCGAVDYVLKSNLHRLAPAVQRAINESSLRIAKAQAETRFRDLIEFAPHAIVVINEDGVIEIVNEEAELLFGYDRQELIGQSGDRLMPDGFPKWIESDRNGEREKRSLSFDLCAQTRNGAQFPAEVSLSPLRTAGGRWISSVIRDISERKAQEERLARLTRIRTILGKISALILRIRDKQALLDEACRNIFQDGSFAGVAVGMHDAATRVVTPVAWAGFDEEFIKELRFSTDESRHGGQGGVGTAIRTRQPVVSNDMRLDLTTNPWREQFLSRGYRSSFVVPLVVGDRSIGVLAIFGNRTGAFNDDEQRLLTELTADLSFALDYIDKEEQINYLAYYDALTGLPNRALFRERLGQLLAMDAVNQGNIAVVMVDIEGFRHINDTLGRSAGDELLREVARRIRDSISDPNYLARISADCFAFVVKESGNKLDVVNLIERKLAMRLSGSVQLMDRDIHVSVRAGVCVFPYDGADGDSLLRSAEIALKQAKVANARTMFYSAEMNARSAQKLSIENRLRRAVEQQQFVLYYQPKVDVMSGRVSGLEALIRWNDPGAGIVMPATFIHVLEEIGLIIEVGNWIIGEAHRQYQEWLASGFKPPRIAVNVSQLQIKGKDLVSHISRMLNTIEPTELEIEITESLFMEGIDQHVAKQKLAALREMGITVAIDDFGTGYSSLSYISRLPIDTLKIDRSFIMNMESSQDDMAIVSTIISLAHSLKLNVVAEGVETQRQFELLASLKCDQIQGFLYSCPLPAQEIETKLRLLAMEDAR